QQRVRPGRVVGQFGDLPFQIIGRRRVAAASGQGGELRRRFLAGKSAAPRQREVRLGERLVAPRQRNQTKPQGGPRVRRIPDLFAAEQLLRFGYVALLQKSFRQAEGKRHPVLRQFTGDRHGLAQQGDRLVGFPSLGDETAAVGPHWVLRVKLRRPRETEVGLAVEQVRQEYHAQPAPRSARIRIGQHPPAGARNR